MLALHKLTAGDGYTYLTRQVAGGDVEREMGQTAADYYTAEGNPPGRWLGYGAHVLKLAGTEVTEQQMKLLYGLGQHPDADKIREKILTRIKPGMSESQIKAIHRKADREASLGPAFPLYQELVHFDARVDMRLDAIRQETGREPTKAEINKAKMEESRAQRAAVAGYDLVFSPVKSAAILWAIHPDAAVRHAVYQAHRDALASALTMLEGHAALTRTGKGGVAQLDTTGLVAVAFDHFDSRAGDPNLHTHVAISNKIQGSDGIWRSLDARALYRLTVATSEHYNSAFETLLSARLGVSFAPRADTPRGKQPVREIAGMSRAYVEHFSARRTMIETRYAQLVREYRRDHGHDPSRKTAYALTRQANLDTREGKKAPRSLESLRWDWTTSLTDQFGTDALNKVAALVPASIPAARAALDLDENQIRESALHILAAVAEVRSTWTAWNIRAEAERMLRGGFISLAEQNATIDKVTAAALGASISVEAPSLTREPTQLQRRGGESVFLDHGTARYTSALVLGAEDRLLNAATTTVKTKISAKEAAASLASFERVSGRQLDAGQRALVEDFATRDTRISIGIGPAGSGKTTAMKALVHVAREHGVRVVALGTSSTAASVLGNELGTAAENTHKFLYEYTEGRYAKQLTGGKHVPFDKRHFKLRKGDILLVDEVGMAGTLNLQRLLEIAEKRGATLRLLGDHRQLSAVESGGALRLLAHATNHVELSTLYRFKNPAEAEATLKISVGDTDGLDFYARNNRIVSGTRDGMTELAYQGWKTDMLAGKRTLLVASNGTDVTALNAQARQDRVEARDVEAVGVVLQDGLSVGVGDWITTRNNDRRLGTNGGRDWVKNGDDWTVTTRYEDGSLTVRHAEHGGTVTLPAKYVAHYVQLAYASTVMREQGTTVETAHALITAGMTREELYVALSRAEYGTKLYVGTHEVLPLDPDERLDYPKTDPRAYAPLEVLINILRLEGAEKSATETIRDNQIEVGSLATFAPRFQYTLERAARPAYRALITESFDKELAERIVESPSWATLRRTLLLAEQAGHNGEFLLREAARRDQLDTLPEPAERLALRITTYLDNRPFAAAYRHNDAPDAAPLPAWLTTPARVHAHQREGDEDLRASLVEQSAQLRERVGQLAERAAAERPAWIEDNRTTPRTPTQDAEWRAHLSTVAAYREQYKITAQDPVRPLGPVVAADESDHLVHRQAEISVGRMLAISSDDTADHSNKAPTRTGRPSTSKRQLAPARTSGVEFEENPSASRRHVDREVRREADREMGY
ncbi:MAG TPA: MobF family relaxase [Actinocrinis sp.]|nr:MobF family relaxase [Actinocrinis sp.]